MAHERGPTTEPKPDRSVLDHIRELVGEEQRLFEHKTPTVADPGCAKTPTFF